MRSFGRQRGRREDALRPLALVACGTLAPEVKELIRKRGWEVDLYGVPALYHLDPKKIVGAVEQTLERLVGRYDRVVVVFGDCGTAGALDRVLARFPAVRPSGPHCYEMLAGVDFRGIMDEHPGTFILTDWLVRNFERAVVSCLGLDRHPELKDTYFAHYTDLLYLRQSPAPALDEKARRIAGSLNLPLEVRDVGLGDLERRLGILVEGSAMPGVTAEQG